MPTHHGRPGGRALEQLLGFSLIAISASMLAGAVALFLGAGYLLVTFGLKYLGAGFVFTIVMASSWASSRFGGAIFRRAFAAAGALWRPYLAYYKYDAKTLRPLFDGVRRE